MLVVSTFTTLDGVVDAPAETTCLPYHDAEVTEGSLAQLTYEPAAEP